MDLNSMNISRSIISIYVYYEQKLCFLFDWSSFGGKLGW